MRASSSIVCSTPAFVIPQRVPLGGSAPFPAHRATQTTRYNIFFMGLPTAPRSWMRPSRGPAVRRQIIFKCRPGRSQGHRRPLLRADPARSGARLTGAPPGVRPDHKGYSPAMIQQASPSPHVRLRARPRGRHLGDLRASMANIEAGLAEPVKYTEREALATARQRSVTAWQPLSYLPYMKSVPFVDPKACSYPGPPSGGRRVTGLQFGGPPGGDLCRGRIAVYGYSPAQGICHRT